MSEKESVFIRHPNGFIMKVSPGTADNLLRKGKGHRRVSAMPPVDMEKLKKEVSNEK